MRSNTKTAAGLRLCSSLVHNQARTRCPPVANEEFGSYVRAGKSAEILLAVQDDATLKQLVRLHPVKQKSAITELLIQQFTGGSDLRSSPDSLGTNRSSLFPSQTPTNTTPRRLRGY